MDAVPEQIDPVAVRNYLEAVAGVVDVHDFHVWAMSTTETALTAHLVTNRATFDDDLTARIAHDLSEHFGIVHPTIQWESTDRTEPCQQGRATLQGPAAALPGPPPVEVAPGSHGVSEGQEDARHE